MKSLGKPSSGKRQFSEGGDTKGWMSIEVGASYSFEIDKTFICKENVKLIYS